MSPADSVPQHTSAGRGKGRSTLRDTAANSLVTLLNLVRSEQATTRQELERESELGRAVVADRLVALSDMGLIDESELGVASGGRAPRLVRFRAEIGRILVATLDQTSIGVGIADLSGRLLMEHHEAADLAAPATSICERICELFDWLIGKRGDGAALWGLSLSVPGPVTEAAQAMFLSDTPGFLPTWDGSFFVEALLPRYGAPVWIRSSVDTMAIGELHAGAGRGANTFLFIKVGKRIGAALVVERRLYRGAQGAAGLIGQFPLLFGDRTATLDTLAGGDMIVREGLAAAQSGRSPVLADVLLRGAEITAFDVGQAAQTGDPACIEILSQSGRMIGHAVAMLANMLNPETIVLSGAIVQSSDILLASVREAVYGESHPLVTRDLPIMRSQMSSSAGLVGAAAMAVEELFAPRCLKDWVTLGSPICHPEFREALDAVARASRDQTRAKAEPPPTAPGRPR